MSEETSATRNLQRSSDNKDNKDGEVKGERRSIDQLHAATNAIKTCRYLKGTTIKKPPNPDAEGLKNILLHPLNILLVFLPLGILSHYDNWGDMPSFWLNFLALVPLAKILGDATEELAASLKNDMVAGLLNATFGNAVELVITVNSLRAGLVRIVKTSLLGSVLSNTLLVLGMSFFFGGIFTLKNAPGVEEVAYTAIAPQDLSRQTDASRVSRDSDSIVTPTRRPTQVQAVDEKIQSFSLLGALVNTSMLLVSCLAFSLITVFRMVLLEEDEDMTDILLPVSRVSSIVVMLAYAAYILFQLVTHRESMSDEGDDDSEEGLLSVLTSTSMLCITTAIIAFVSDMMVDTIHGLTENSQMSEHFIGIILLPIVGNACEHAAAVRFAVQDKLGLSVSIAVGSSTQIALFVVPLSVIFGWVMHEPMDLNFGVLNSALITLSVIVVLSMVVDGQSNWLQGYLLCSVYAIISVMYWNLPNDVNDGMD